MLFFLAMLCTKKNTSTCRPFCAFVYLTLLRRKFLPQQLIVFLFDMDASSYFLSFCAKKQDLFLLCVTKSSKFVAVVVFCLHIRACCCQIWQTRLSALLGLAWNVGPKRREKKIIPPPLSQRHSLSRLIPQLKPKKNAFANFLNFFSFRCVIFC